MNNLRIYGKEPYAIAVLHGGPGASGEMAPVARALSCNFGILEPLQTSGSIEGQVQELRSIIEENETGPVALIGHSWGAWLGFIFAARFPSFVRKLILVGCGPFEDKYVSSIMRTRLSRLAQEEIHEMQKLEKMLIDPHVKDNGDELERFGKLMSKVDSFDPLPSEEDIIECQPDIFQNVWREAEELRRSGKLLELGRQIQCPVLAIHGDYDPHPFEGVKKPLTQALKDFRFVLLEKSGHSPWIERNAKKEFYDILNAELK